MLRRSAATLSSLSLLFSLWLVAPSASAGAGAKDKQALAMADHAIASEYLATRFEAAETELKQALALCVAGACSPQVVARLHRDLGVVYIAGMSRSDAGKAELAEAFKADPEVALDPDLTTPEVETAFVTVAVSLGIEPKWAPKEATAAGKPSGAASRAAAEGDIVHTPPAEQAVSTPVPLYVEAAPGVSFRKVKVHYRPYGSTEWKTLELDHVKGGFGIEIPCLDVGATGTLSYFIQAYDQGGDVGALSGSRQEPHQVAIVRELSSDPPHLPGRPPPAQCRDRSDCPPDFPGCESKDTGVSDKRGQASAPFLKNWLSLAVQQDFMIVGGGKQICDPNQSPNYACFQSGDRYYDVVALPRASGEVAGGVGVATTRILAGYDRVLGESWSIGARAGYAFGGGPTPPGGAAFLPAHGEGRLAYWFGPTPFARAGVRPFVQASGGIAQVDTKIGVKTFDNQQAFQADRRTDVDAWRKAGTGFVSLGGGAAYALGNRHVLVAELRFMQMLGLPATAMGLNVGYGFGL